ncbi:MAG: four helix bundle protein [Victivallales bacterium]
MKCETLKVWKTSARLSADVYKIFSDCKDYGFKDQITRSCLSIPSNIAGGSTAEFATQVYIGMDIAYIEKSVGKEWIDKSDHRLAMLANLKKTIRNRDI